MISMLDLQAQYQSLKPEIDKAVARCFLHQQWILGPEIKELEKQTASYLGVQHSIGASSGTDALIIALRALAIKTKGREFFDREDKIITTPFTFTATGGAIVHAGATPLFVDIDPNTFNLNPDLVAKALKTVPNVVGILPVHLYGQACDMDAILGLAKQYNVFVVEDVAQGFGATWNNKKIGSIGHMGAFSFFPSKNLGGCGDGGLIATDDDHLAELSHLLVKHGAKEKYNAIHLGYNARLDTLQAAILLAKLPVIDEWNERRRKIADKYNEAFKGLADLIIPSPLASEHVYHQYTLRVLNDKREALQQYLKEQGISSMIYYPIPLHKMKVFAEYGQVFGKLNYSEQLAEQVLSLPIEPLMNDEEVQQVIRTVHEFLHV